MSWLFFSFFRDVHVEKDGSSSKRKKEKKKHKKHKNKHKHSSSDRSHKHKKKRLSSPDSAENNEFLKKPRYDDDDIELQNRISGSLVRNHLLKLCH